MTLWFDIQIVFLLFIELFPSKVLTRYLRRVQVKLNNRNDLELYKNNKTKLYF